MVGRVRRFDKSRDSREVYAMVMKAGRDTGSLINHMMSYGSGVKPEVGMGATILCWTDRHAGTIVKVTPSQVHVQHDKATRVDKNGMSEAQEYRYEADPNGSVEVFRWSKKKNGYRNAAGNGLLVGRREGYYDFSF
jgi:hypothetical protein